MPHLGSRTFRALGTTATVVVADGGRLQHALEEVQRELEHIDRTCSRFREDSDLTHANDADGGWTRVDDLLVTAVEVALRAARVTGGLVDPTVGRALLRIGYDRNFAEIPTHGPALPPAVDPIELAGWRLVGVGRDPSRIRVPRGMQLDLGSTAKALAADRGAAGAARAVGCGVMLGLGGDVALGGDAPLGGWPIGIADDHAATPEPGETISIAEGGVATSSTTVRRWSRGGLPMHHIIDPRSGVPAREVWRTVSVHAGTCVDANTASTAAIILGEEAPGWLASQGLPARLVRADGAVVRVAGWPEREAA